MDTIDQHALVRAAEMISALDPAQVGHIHTVTLSLHPDRDGRIDGELLVTVQSTRHADIITMLIGT